MRIDVCIATFRRPGLLGRLLGELAAQRLPAGSKVHLIVVDNDVLESARAVVAAYQAAGLSIEYVTQAEPNISLTRNCALDHSHGDMIAFIDDDESAPAEWLSTLIAAMRRWDADVVLGPVTGIPVAGSPEWIAKGRLFERPTLSSGTRVKLGGAGNALMKASVVRGKIAFDPRYGLSGGEDTDFFNRLAHAGAVMVWCQEALLTEDIPQERVNVRWLLRRGFGAGQSYADIVDRPRGGVRLAVWLVKRASLAIVATVLGLACMPFNKALAVRWAIKAATNLGQVSTIGRYRHQAYGRTR